MTPGAWELILATAGAISGVCVLLFAGMTYGRLAQRLVTVEDGLREWQGQGAKGAEMQLQFESMKREFAAMGADLARRLDRIEHQSDKGEV